MGPVSAKMRNLRLPRRTRYSVVDPAQDRNGGLVVQASDKEQAYTLAAAFGKALATVLWVVKVR